MTKGQNTEQEPPKPDDAAIERESGEPCDWGTIINVTIKGVWGHDAYSEDYRFSGCKGKYPNYEYRFTRFGEASIYPSEYKDITFKRTDLKVGFDSALYKINRISADSVALRTPATPDSVKEAFLDGFREGERHAIAPIYSNGKDAWEYSESKASPPPAVTAEDLKQIRKTIDDVYDALQGHGRFAGIGDHIVEAFHEINGHLKALESRLAVDGGE